MESMKRKEFVRKYCQDIVDSAKQRKDIIPEIDFTFDEYVTDEDGEQLKAIRVGGSLVLVRDILTLSEKDFILTYGDGENLTACRTYLENFIIIEGEEVVAQVRKQLARSNEKIDRYSNMDLEDMI